MNHPLSPTCIASDPDQPAGGAPPIAPEFLARARLTYFHRSRREFLQLGGLSLGAWALGRALPAAPRPLADPPAVGVDEVLARALVDAGVKVVTHVPATGATAIHEAWHRLRNTPPAYAFHEEVAFTVAHGAGLAGVRAAAVIKSHGLAKAANSVLDALTLGTTAGFVTLVLDDPTGRHSDNIFDLNAFLVGTGMPFKTARADTAADALIECFLWSEELRTPVALFLDAAEVARQTVHRPRPLPPPAARYARDPFRHVLCPPLAGYQRQVLEARLARTPWQGIPEPTLPAVPDGLPPNWRPAAAAFAPLFEVFQALRPAIPFVSGDTGLSSLFAFAPFSCIDACSYYGGSLPLALGFHLAGGGRAWAVTGDYAFLAAGHLGLIEALACQAPLKVLIMDNGRAMATGGQPIPAGLLDQVLSGWSPYVTRIDDPNDRAAVRRVLARVNESDRLEIVAARFRP